MAQIPGANPAYSSGYSTMLPDGTEVSVVVEAQAVWFVMATQALGILTLTLAAYLNVVILRSIASGKPSSPATGQRPSKQA